MRKILAVNDFGSTGIAESLTPVLQHFHEQGHEVWQLALGYTGWASGLDKKKYPWHDRLMPMYGATSVLDRFGQRIIKKALDQSQADIVITAFDIWMVSYFALPERDVALDSESKTALSHESRTFRHIAYFPIDGAVDGEHLPLGIEEMICGFDYPVTYSRFSQAVIERDIHIHVPFIPIAHDPNIYKPGSKKESRKSVGLPEEGYIVGMIATNQYRKLWGDFFDATVPFAKNHDDVFILPWTTWETKLAGGSEINDLVWRSGVGERIIDPKRHVGQFNDEGMANLYRSLDVLVLLTVGEGAGLPPIRARACGIPTLVSDNTSNTEFCVDDFERIPSRGTFYDPIGSNLRRYLPDVEETTRRLERLYTDDLLRKKLSMMGQAGTKQYEIENVMPYWDAFLEEVK